MKFDMAFKISRAFYRRQKNNNFNVALMDIRALDALALSTMGDTIGGS